MDAALPPPVHLHEVVDGLALNPALPAAMIRRLFPGQPGSSKVAMRPDLTDEMIAEIIATGGHRLVHSLALNGRLPDGFRLRLAAHPDEGIRAALVVRGDTAPRQLFEILLGDPEPHVRERLAQSRHTPPDLRARLAADPDPAIRAALAKHWTQAPEDVRRLLLTDPEPAVRGAACSTYFAALPHPIPPADLVPALLADPVTRAGAVIHAALDAATLRLLADDPDSDVRTQLARHPDLPPQVRDVLAVDPALDVQVAVFARQDTPADMRARIHASVHELARLAKDRDIEADGADGDDADAEKAMMRWVKDAFAPQELRTMHLAWVAADPLPHLGSPYVSFRASAAHNRSLPADAVARLLDDEEDLVRLAMASTAGDLIDPAAAESVERRYRLRKNKFTFWWEKAEVLTFPPETLRRFATDPAPRLRSLAPRDPDLPPELADQLAADPEYRVRLAVAAHRNLPLPALLRLLADPVPQIAEAAGASPILPVEYMEQLLVLAGL